MKVKIAGEPWRDDGKLYPSLAHPTVSDEQLAGYYRRTYGLNITEEQVKKSRLGGEVISVAEWMKRTEEQ